MGTSRVLVVDDDEAFATLTRTFLTRIDDSLLIDIQTDPTAVVEQLQTSSYDCVVSDYDMPTQNGLQLLSSIRSIDDHLPFILFTGKGSEEIASKAVSKGVTDYLQKKGSTDQYTVLANRIQNVIEQRRSTQALEASERRYRTLVETSPVGIHIFDRNGVLLYANEASAALFGADSPEDVVGDCVLEYIHPADRAEAETRLANIFQNNSSAPEITQQVVSKNGETKYTLTATSPITYKGKPAGQAVSHNITAQVATEKQLAEQTETIEILHAAAGALMEADSEQAVYENMVQFAEGVLAFDVCAVNTYDDGKLVAAAVSETAASSGYYTELSVEETIAGQTYNSGESAIIYDLSTNETHNTAGAYRSLISVPIGDLGVFQAGSHESHAFSASDKRHAELLVFNAANRIRWLKESKDV